MEQSPLEGRLCKSGEDYEDIRGRKASSNGEGSSMVVSAKSV